MASTDIITLSIVVALMLFFDTLAYRTGKGMLFLVAEMLGVYTLGWIFTNQSVTFLVAQDPGATSFSLYTIDPNLWAVIFASLDIATVLMLYYSRWN